MNNFFVVSKPSFSKTVGNIEYSRYNNTPPAPPKPTTKTVAAVVKANAIKQQAASVSSAASNVKSEVKSVSGISHLITNKQYVKPYRTVSGISHLLQEN